MKISRLIAPAAAALTIVAGSAYAQTTAGTAESSDAAAAAEAGVSTSFVRAYDIAMARINQTLTHEQMAEINLMSYAAAASGLCDDLALDESAVYGALVALTHDQVSDDPDSDAEMIKDFSLIAFGVMTGLILESAVEDEAAFCAEAVSYMDEMGLEAYLVPASTGSSPAN